MISRLPLVLPVIQKGEETTEDEHGASLTHAEGAQVGRALQAFLQTGRCSGGVGVEPVRRLEVAMFLCACWCVAERTLSGRERTAPDPFFSVYTDKFSRRSLQPAAPYCSQIFISALFVPGRPAADNPPAAYPGRNATSRPEQPTGASRRSSEGLMLRKGS